MERRFYATEEREESDAYCARARGFRSIAEFREYFNPSTSPERKREIRASHIDNDEADLELFRTAK